MMERDRPTPLRSIHGRRVAVLLTIDGRQVVCRGTGSYEFDSTLGHVLRITLTDSSGQEIIISEAQWEGAVEVDDQYGCDYLISIS